MLRNPSLFDWDTRRRKVGRLFDGKCHRKLDRHQRKLVVRVKRCGKSAPREAQATRHGKPHRVQGQIGNRGAARSASAKANRFRVSVAETNDSLRSQECRQNSAYSPSKTNLLFCRSRGDEAQISESKKYLETPHVVTYFFILVAPFAASGAEYFFNVQTAGSLKFPRRSTARSEMASGIPALK